MELAMGAWADWVSSKVDPLKKRVFFVTMSPTHLWWALTNSYLVVMSIAICTRKIIQECYNITVHALLFKIKDKF
jgi:hypothetical protein